MGSSSSRAAKRQKLTTRRAQQLSAQTHMPLDELNELHQAFLRKFGSSEVAREQMIELYTALHPDDPKNPIIKHLFRQIECRKGAGCPSARGSGAMIRFEDFAASVAIVEHSSIEEQLSWLFALFDIDGNKEIDKFELLEIVRTAYRLTSRKQQPENGDSPSQQLSAEERIKQTFSRTDENSDGVLTKEEFVNACSLNQDVCGVLVGSVKTVLRDLKQQILATNEKPTANSEAQSHNHKTHQ